MAVIKRTIIAVPRGSVEAICKAKNVRKSTVYGALNFANNSETAQEIRRLAIEEFNGFETKKAIYIKH